MRADLTNVDVRRAVTLTPHADLPWFIRCREPGHDDSTQSMAVYAGHVSCYGCGFHIDRRMEALAYLLKCSVYDAIKRAAEFYRLPETARQTRAKVTKRLSPVVADLYADVLWNGRQDRLVWLRDRGLTDDTIKRYQLGHDTTRFTIPVRDRAGNLISIRFRRDDLFGTQWWDGRNNQLRSVPKYTGLAGYNDVALYPLNALHYLDGCLFLCEGELDVIRLWQEGYNAATVTNGARSLSRAFDLLAAQGITPANTVLYLVGDQDAPGRLGMRQVFIDGTRLGYRIALGEWPLAWGKDVTDLFLSGRTLSQVKWLVNSHYENSRRCEEQPHEVSNGYMAGRTEGYTDDAELSQTA